MSAQGDHRKWPDALAAYALGAVGDRDAAEIEAHLESCERCRAELESLNTAIEVIPASVERHEPPPRLKSQIMEVVNAEAAQSERPAPRGSAFSGLFARLGPALSVGIVIVIGLAAAAGYTLRGSPEESTRVALEPTPSTALAVSGQVTAEDGAGTLVVQGLPPLENGDVYQAWLRRGDEIVPSSVFVLDRAGRGVAAIPAGLDGVDEVMITREPEGGSQSPSSAPLLSGEVS